MQTSNCQPSQC